MIVNLSHTITNGIAKALVKIREEGGVVTLGRVLTLVISTTMGAEEEAVEAANDASREHPMRVIVIAKADDEHPAVAAAGHRLDAQIRVGSDAGASEVIILRAYGDVAADEEGLVTALLLPDAPIVVWWPRTAPVTPSDSPLGRIATRRITDTSVQADPVAAIRHNSATYRPGDTDFAWTRLTLWRAQLAAVLDQPPYAPVTHVRVTGAEDSPSTYLLAAWLRMTLDAPVDQDITTRARGSSGIHGVRLTRESGVIELRRDAAGIATLTQPHRPTHDLALARRNLRDCLAEELRGLDPDELYGEVITKGIALMGREMPIARSLSRWEPIHDDGDDDTGPRIPDSAT